MVLTHADRGRRRFRIAKNLRAGMSPASVAAKYRVSLSLVYWTAREHKIRLLSTRRISYMGTLRVLGALFRAREPNYARVAKRLGCSREWVSHVAKIARQQGIPVPK